MNLRPALLLILCALPLASSVADDVPATVKQGSPGCMTYDLLDKLLDAILKDDQATGEGLLKDGGCIILKEDMRVKILDFHGNDIEIEVPTGSTTIQMWVPGKYIEN